MLSVKGGMGGILCIEQVCFEVTQEYGAPMVEKLKYFTMYIDYD